MFSSIDLSTVAFATELGHRPVAGVILGTYALGSAVGGLWYGSRHWRAPIGRRFTITAALTVVGVSTFWAVPGLLALDAVGFVAGLAISPTLMAGYAILERQAPPHRRTEAMAWLSSTISVGVALGSAVAGHIIDAHGRALELRLRRLLRRRRRPDLRRRARQAARTRAGRGQAPMSQRITRVPGGTGPATSRPGPPGSRTPRSAAEVADEVTRAAADGLTIRMTGSGHSFTPTAGHRRRAAATRAASPRSGPSTPTRAWSRSRPAARCTGSTPSCTRAACR